MTLSALADPTRRAILARLSRGEASVKELAEPFAMSLPAVSKHLKVLERAGLISRGREAQWRPCRLEAEPLRTGVNDREPGEVGLLTRLANQPASPSSIAGPSLAKMAQRRRDATSNLWLLALRLQPAISSRPKSQESRIRRRNDIAPRRPGARLLRLVLPAFCTMWRRTVR